MNPFALINDAILQALLFFYNLTGQNMGYAIITLTLAAKLLLLPLSITQTKQQKKMADLKPKFDELKEKHKDDKMKQQEEQLRIMREHNVNPAAGCLPLIVQIILIISLYQVFVQYLGPEAQINGEKVHTQFFFWDLAKPDPWYLLPILAGITQFIFSAMLTPAQSVAVRKDDSKKEVAEKEDFASAMQQVQGQMLYLTPIMTGLVAVGFASGLSLHWVVSNLFSIIQQYFTVGLGHLNSHLTKIRDIINRNKQSK